jgi:uncharacterized glyoxalase superfamily protein PhnB
MKMAPVGKRGPKGAGRKWNDLQQERESCSREVLDSQCQRQRSSKQPVPSICSDRRTRRKAGDLCAHIEEEEVVTSMKPLTRFAPPTPELPVEDVERAQEHYRDVLGFEIGWLYPGKEIGAVSRDDVSIFFRKRSRPFEPAIHWVFAEEIDAMYDELCSSGAKIVSPLEKKLWGLRQFTIGDIDGNCFHFHCD